MSDAPQHAGDWQPSGKGHDHGGHGHGGGHGHTHGVVDPTIATTDEGIWAIKWSFVGLFLTASLQLVVVLLRAASDYLLTPSTISATPRPLFRFGWRSRWRDGDRASASPLATGGLRI